MSLNSQLRESWSFSSRANLDPRQLLDKILNSSNIKAVMGAVGLTKRRVKSTSVRNQFEVTFDISGAKRPLIATICVFPSALSVDVSFQVWPQDNQGVGKYEKDVTIDPDRIDDDRLRPAFRNTIGAAANEIKWE